MRAFTLSMALVEQAAANRCGSSCSWTATGGATRGAGARGLPLAPDSTGGTDSAEPTGVIAGDTGLYRIFTCPSRPDRPDAARVDLR
jgi:hypothetical protein